MIKVVFAAFMAAIFMSSAAFCVIPQPPPLNEVVTECEIVDDMREDIEDLARCVYAEARGQPYEVQLAVATVVLNRLSDGRWGDTVYSVINDCKYNGKKIGKQFAYWRKDIKEPLAFKSCMKASEAALCGGGNLPDDVFFFQEAKKQIWHGAAPYYKIGCFYFYKGG